eukprot:scaffold2917_cov191-Amphora_coffeaeformis.AAC.19
MMMDMMIIHPVFQFAGLCTLILDTQDHFIEQGNFFYRMFVFNFLLPHSYRALFNLVRFAVKCAVRLVISVVPRVVKCICAFIQGVCEKKQLPTATTASAVPPPRQTGLATKVKKVRKTAVATEIKVVRKPARKPAVATEVNVARKKVVKAAPVEKTAAAADPRTMKKSAKKSILDFPVRVNRARAPKKARTPQQEERQITNLMKQVGCTRKESAEFLRRTIEMERSMGCY